MEQIRVLVVGTSSPHVANCINRIQAEDISIRIVSNGNEFLPKEIPCDIVDFSLVNPINWVLTVRTLSKVIHSFKPDVIHIHQANAVAFYVTLANLWHRIPTVLTAWGSDILINPNKSWLLRIMVKFILKRVDHCTADAQFLADEMQLLVPLKKLKITCCNFGVVPMDIPITKERIVYSNRTHNKLYRIDKVIEGFHRFSTSRKGEDWKLVIAGRGSETDELKAQCERLTISDKVAFVGFLTPEQNAAYYSRSSFFISLPESDATAVSLLEAMYYKCVPIVSNLPANKEWINDGENGAVVSDLMENYIERALMTIDHASAGEMNQAIIREKGTVEVSEKCFRKVVLTTAGKIH